MQFSDLLSLNVSCEMLSGSTGCLLLIGDGAAALANQWPNSSRLQRTSGALRVLFGLPVLTLPYPVLVNSLMTEHNTRLDQLSLFGWIEDNGIMEPRAEVLGLTPLAEDPLLFLRDLDLDRPLQAYVQPRPGEWLRVVGVIIASTDYVAEPALLEGADAALSAIRVVLPADAQGLLKALRIEVDAGMSLHHALRIHRRTTSAALMAQCDGWRVLARAARFVLAGPLARDIPFRLDAPRTW
ncbi:MAG TPA: hypothetical protein VGK81_13475 [Anaerolineae bacterium]